MHSDNPAIDRVRQALVIYRSIAACNRQLSRGSDVHALTAALMLPCYRAQFERLVRGLGPEEEQELMAGLRQVAG